MSFCYGLTPCLAVSSEVLLLTASVVMLEGLVWRWVCPLLGRGNVCCWHALCKPHRAESVTLKVLMMPSFLISALILLAQGFKSAVWCCPFRCKLNRRQYRLNHRVWILCQEHYGFKTEMNSISSKLVVKYLVLLESPPVLTMSVQLCPLQLFTWIPSAPSRQSVRRGNQWRGAGSPGNRILWSMDFFSKLQKIKEHSQLFIFWCTRLQGILRWGTMSDQGCGFHWVQTNRYSCFYSPWRMNSGCSPLMSFLRIILYDLRSCFASCGHLTGLILTINMNMLLEQVLYYGADKLDWNVRAFVRKVWKYCPKEAGCSICQHWNFSKLQTCSFIAHESHDGLTKWQYRSIMTVFDIGIRHSKKILLSVSWLCMARDVPHAVPLVLLLWQHIKQYLPLFKVRIGQGNIS